MDKKKVFVTYGWDNEEFNERVYSFVNLLREKGFNATCDKAEMQESTSPNFSQIMHEGLNSDKVIVVLSNKYKEKVDNPSTGVNTEYNIINSERQSGENAKKYIFVSFEGTSEQTRKQIVPIMFSGIPILDLKTDEENEFNELFSKLLDEDIIEFSEVADKNITIKKKSLSSFSLSNEEEKVVLKFTLSEDQKTVSYDNTTKNKLRECLSKEQIDIAVEIQDEYIESLKNWKEEQDRRIADGVVFSNKDEEAYSLVANTINSYSRYKIEVEKKAILFFLSSKEIKRIMINKDVITYLNVIKEIILISRLKQKDMNDYMPVDGFIDLKEGSFSFRAHVKRNNLNEETKQFLRFRDVNIRDFTESDIISDIIPNYCLYIKRNYDRFENVFKNNERLFDLSQYRFGIG